MLSLVRWYNVLLMAIGLYLSSIFLLNPEQSWVSTLKNPSLHLNVFALCFFVMGGYIINAFYDFEKDMVNKPKTTVFDRVVSKSFCLSSYLLFNFCGTVLSLFLGWKVFLFNCCLCFGLWFYSHKLRKKPFTGELSATVLTIAPFVSLSLLYMTTNLKIGLYIGFLFAMTLTREIIKKLENMKGDLVFGDQSLPILFGIKKTKYLTYVLMFLSVIPVGILFPQIKDRPVFYFLIVSCVLILVAAYLLYPAQEQKGFKKVNGIYKLLITLSVFALTLA